MRDPEAPARSARSPPVRSTPPGRHSPRTRGSSGPTGGSLLHRRRPESELSFFYSDGLSRLGLPYTLTRSPLRQLVPFAWAHSASRVGSHRASTVARTNPRCPTDGSYP